MRIILALALGLLNTVTFASNEAETHLIMMIEKYRSLSTYEDNGSSITKFTSPDGSNFKKELNFTTKYIENNSLHFQWIKQPNELGKKLAKMPEYTGNLGKPKTYTVWKDKNGAYSSYPFREKEVYSNLEDALSGATGISSGLASMVPRFLSPEISCPPKLGAIKSELLKSNPDIILIKQTHSTGGTSTLHIDKSTYLLKEFETNDNLPNGTHTQQIVKYNITNAK